MSGAWWEEQLRGHLPRAGEGREAFERVLEALGTDRAMLFGRVVEPGEALEHAVRALLVAWRGHLGEAEGEDGRAWVEARALLRNRPIDPPPPLPRDARIAAAVARMRECLAEEANLGAHWREHGGVQTAHVSYALPGPDPSAALQVAQAEARLGRRLPDGLKALYAEVAGFALLIGDVPPGPHAWPGSTERYFLNGYTRLVLVPPHELRELSPGDLLFGWIAQTGFLCIEEDAVLVRPSSKNDELVSICGSLGELLEQLTGVGFLVTGLD